MNPFLDDGYTIESKIEVKPFDPFTIKHRPLVGPELSWLSADEANNGPVLLARKITEWDMKGPDGKPVSITAERISKLHYHVYGALFAKVVGQALKESDLKN